jgi:SAM-dependent methyltransferase
MTTKTTEAQRATEDAVEALAERLFLAGVGAVELCNAYLGVRLGLYRELGAAGGGTAVELAARTGLNERYLREWLQSGAISGLLEVDGDDPATARFALADGVEPVLVDETSPAYLGGLPATLAAAAAVLPRLADAFRSGEPVPYAEYGQEAVSAQASFNRPAFANSLVAEWLPQVPDVLARLRDESRPARVGDFACGAGWAAIELAKAFPHLRVDGLDNDEASIASARRNAVDAGVADRVDLEVRDLSGGAGDWSPRYDAVFFFECVHDFPRPVEALRNARAALREGGSVIVMDERTEETLTAPGDEVERFFAGVSPLWCLPQGLVGPDPEPVGTIMRPAVLESLAERAGYRSAEILPIEHPFWRFYRLIS